MDNIIKQLPNSFDATSWGKEIHRRIHMDDKYDLIRLLIIKNDLGIFKVLTYDLKWKDLHISKNEVTLTTADNQILYFVDEFDYEKRVVTRSIRLPDDNYNFIKFTVNPPPGGGIISDFGSEFGGSRGL